MAKQHTCPFVLAASTLLHAACGGSDDSSSDSTSSDSSSAIESDASTPEESGSGGDKASGDAESSEAAPASDCDPSSDQGRRFGDSSHLNRHEAHALPRVQRGHSVPRTCPEQGFTGVKRDYSRDFRPTTASPTPWHETPGHVACRRALRLTSRLFADVVQW